VPSDRSLVLATHNPPKVREVGRILGPRGIVLHPLPDHVVLPPEHGETFAENALAKARTAAAQTGRVAIADDSGIEAEALSGAPGVRSARYAGPQASDAQNLHKLIHEVSAGTALRYVCALACVRPRTGEEQVFFGECRGHMAARPRGTRGFGYDPVFVPDEAGDGHTMAELTETEKDAISHRGRAVRAFAAAWQG
jgi:XTP/dITP diphosphohydrolase